MIRHLVLLRLKPETSPSLKRTLFADLAALRGHLAGVLGFHAGPNDSVEPEVRRSFGDAFWFDFEDEASRSAYLEDGEHKAIGTKPAENCVDGRQGLVAFDMTV